MGANLMYSPLESVFESTMEREGKILTTYSSGIEFRAFFRIRNDNENQRETIVIYYDVTAPVSSGTLIMIGKEVFLALNKETVENDVYYKSTMIKCNGVYNSNDGEVSNMPFYTDNMKSSVSLENNIISMLNGNIEILTKENTTSKRININDTFNEFNRTFVITNKYSIDGIMHFLGEVKVDEKPDYNYSIQIDGFPGTKVETNTVIQLEAIPYVNGNVTSGATFEWRSSNESVTVVDNTGMVTCLSKGMARITVTWVEKDVSEVLDVTVVNGEEPSIPAYKYGISGNTKLRIGYYRTYTFTVLDGFDNPIENMDCVWNVISDFNIKQDISENKIILSVDNEDLIGRKIMLQAIYDGKIVAEIEIVIVE